MDSLVNDDAAAAAAAMTREDDATAAIDGAETRETGDGGDVDAPRADEARKPPTNPNKKRKCAVTFAYVGAGYAGMQRNPGVRTIEGELEGAIARAGGISDANAGDFAKVQWTRAARTDKGVSAVGQVVALKMVLEPSGMVERINAALPERFEVFGIDRVTGGFNAKTMCDRRRYEYGIPTRAFDPNLGAEGAAEAFAFTEETRSRVDGVLKNYCGTHNFHNYTVKVKPTDAQAKRYIISFECSAPFEVEGEQFVRCQVVGQSFMLHQIRKLIGTMLAVVRGELTEDDQKFALLTHEFVPTPMAPELGLFLCECIYKAYNDKFGGVHENFELAKYSERSESFKQTHVYPHIAKKEREESTMQNWIRDVLCGRDLRDQFDAAMAASLARDETLDVSRVGHRQSKKRQSLEDSRAARADADAFRDVLLAGADRAKSRKLSVRFNDRSAEIDRAEIDRAASAARVVPIAPPPPPTSRARALDDAELSDGSL